jgi:hypothetical protein
VVHPPGEIALHRMLQSDGSIRAVLLGAMLIGLGLGMQAARASLIKLSRLMSWTDCRTGNQPDRHC